MTLIINIAHVTLPNIHMALPLYKKTRKIITLLGEDSVLIPDLQEILNEIVCK